MNKLILSLFVAASCLLAGCQFTPPPPPPNPLQIEAMQTQQFDADKRATFDAVMTVLQNEGYTITAANYNTGFITAQSATKQQTPDFNNFMFEAFAGGSSRGGPTYESVNRSVTVFVSPVKTAKTKPATKVRLNFVTHRMISGRGANRQQDTQVLNPDVYKEAFKDIRQQVFVAGATS